jgi:hypothetical protein
MNLLVVSTYLEYESHMYSNMLKSAVLISSLSLLVVSCAQDDDASGDQDLFESEMAQQLVAAKCDEDNRSRLPDTDPGVLAASVPPSMTDFIRREGWNCMHRGWHAVRGWNFMLVPADKQFAVDHGWLKFEPGTTTLVDPRVASEGAPTNGLEFLAMHRVMLSMLRAQFPQYSQVLAGWTIVPQVDSVDDRLPPMARNFDSNYASALSRLSSAVTLKAFQTDDEFGAYIQTKHFPGRGRDIYALNPDRSAGIHNYMHNRFNIADVANPAFTVRMSNFSRNIENKVFWKLHGWLDGRWTAFRTAMGFNDTTDVNYRAAMNAACTHMNRGPWRVTANGTGSCAPRPAVPEHNHTH